MEILLILALLASNVWLIRKVLTKPGNPTASPASEEPPPAEEPAKPEVSDVVGKSTFNVEEFKEIFTVAAKEAAKEIIPLIVKEYGTPADAGLPEEPPIETPSARIPNDKLDETFRHHSASEITGDEPVAAEPEAGGVDFDDLQSAYRVLKDEPHTEAEEKNAYRVVREISGTEVMEVIKLDPVVRKKILMLECQLPDLSEFDDEQDGDDNPEASDTVSDSNPPKKIVFHVNVDTTDIDGIDLNLIY